MISQQDLLRIARARLADAEVLLERKRYDGAVYIVGYAIEAALKARTCKTLKWIGFPETRKDFENFTSFRTHNLGVLLTLSGREQTIKDRYLSDWSNVATWEPERRYRRIGSASKSDAESMINSTKIILKAIWKS
ncbi:MAG: HEPN domain-containing protein [Pirellulales bacterium]